MSLPDKYQSLIAKGQGNETGYKIVDLPLEKPGDNQVLVKIDYAPLHAVDISVMNGEYPLCDKIPHPVGFEGVGTVVAVGNNLKVPHKVGDKVYVYGIGTMAQYLITQSEYVALIEENLSLEDAAPHFGNPATVYYMGVIAEEGKHKAVINTPGSSSLGRMLIRYFKQKGIKTINIVRRDDFTEELKAEGADYVLNSQAPDFEEKLKDIVKNEQPTMALDALGGTITNKIWKALPKKSTLYMYDCLADENIKDLNIMELLERKSVCGLNLYNYIEELEEKGEFVKFFKEVHSLVPTVFRSKIIKIFKLSELEEALQYYKENSSKGKILLKPN